MKSVYLIVGSAIVIGSIIFLRKKKIADDKIQAEEIAKAEETLKKDFEIAVHNAGVVQAEAMNIDLINEKKAYGLMPFYNGLWKQLLALGSVPASDKRLKNLKSQIADIEKQINDLGYRVIVSPRSVNGSTLVKK